MCGLAALIGEGPVPTAPLAPMLDMIRHRGPDDEGWVAFEGAGLAALSGGGRDTPVACYSASLPYAPVSGVALPLNAQVALGHRRLSILDVSPGGHQPMSCRDGRYWIVFNGEIYNHLALRRELEMRGHVFVSRSDTEVVLAAYSEWGETCLGRFEGMFAFVLVDRVEAIVFAARDRFGIKPLYYWAAPDRTLALASEIKQFSKSPHWQPRLNGQRAYDFLAWSILDHTDETMFLGVFQLRPGHSLHLELRRPLAVQPDGRLESCEWYRLKPAFFEGSLQDAAQRFRTLFDQSVQAHLQADVLVGSCLSGGLDSSSIVCAMSQFLRRQSVTTKQHTFSACSAVKQFNEREYIEEVVRHTGVEPHYIYPDLDSLFAKLDQVTWHQDEPFGSSSIFAQWSVFALAAEHGIKVMLDGQGADEQLAGYPHYHGARLASLFRQLRWIRLAREMRATSTIHGNGQLWAFKFFANAILPDSVRRPLRAMAGRDKTAPDWLNLVPLQALARDPFGGKSGGSIRGLSYQQLTRSNLQMLLHWEDRDSMAHSVEARVPFLDHHLVEFVLGLPDDYKLSGGVTKRILRESLRGVLPEAIRGRMSKLGFATPEESWIRQQAPQKFREAMQQSIESSQGVLRSCEALKAFDEIVDGKRPFDFAIWRMISFARWLERFDVRVA